MPQNVLVNVQTIIVRNMQLCQKAEPRNYFKFSLTVILTELLVKLFLTVNYCKTFTDLPRSKNENA